MKGLGPALLGIGCFACGLGVGLAWKQPRDEDIPATVFPTKAPPAPARERVAGTPPLASKKERAAKKIPDAGTPRNQDASDWHAQDKARKSIQHLVDDALQLDDAGKRATAIEGIRAAIASGDPDKAFAGLLALSAIHEVAFDKASFREVLKLHLHSENPQMRASAWYGMLQAGMQEDDLQLLRETARTRDMGRSTAHLLHMAEKGDLTGESGDIVRDLLRSNDPQARRSAMNGIWGASFSPELEADLIALSYQKEYLHDAIYNSLSPQSNKGAATVDRLIEVLAEPDGNTSGRAAWGLNHGVPEELQPRVADAAAKVVESRASGYLATQSWDLLKRYHGPENLEALRELAAKPGLNGERKLELQQMVAALENDAAR